VSIIGATQSGQSGMATAKTAIATAGHNISNANTKGFSRQRTINTTQEPESVGRHQLGRGVRTARIERVNDQYVEKQLRNGNRDLANLEERDMALRQIEDIFNEMEGDGINRMMTQFFNEFRKLANDPNNEAIRQAVRESSVGLTKDFSRLRDSVDNVRLHIDSRIESGIKEVNSLIEEIKGLNTKIKKIQLQNGSPNDLMDSRDVALAKLSEFLDISTHTDEHGQVYIDIPEVGPLLSGGSGQTLQVGRSPADEQGKPENAYDIMTTAYAGNKITHQIRGGRLGALLEVRDHSLSSALDRLDEMAFAMVKSVNQVHREAYTRNGIKGVDYFKDLGSSHRAAEFISLSSEVFDNINNIATAFAPDSPGDNRAAVAISKIQGAKFLNGGHATFDEVYNSIVTDVGVVAGRNRSALQQQQGVVHQLEQMREQISGVSLEEETANLMQHQQAYQASANVIKIANDMLNVVNRLLD
jgi:flagellar hook-associated protein 1